MTKIDDGDLVYDDLRIDLDDINAVAVQLQNALYEVSNGRTHDLDEFDGFVHTTEAGGHLAKCRACHADYDVDMYGVAAITAPDEEFNTCLCKDCAEGIAGWLEDYIEENTDMFLGDTL